MLTPSANILDASDVSKDSDTILGIENVIGTSNADTITGDDSLINVNPELK